jgi:rSAM/selenodomain-associated transferase 1
VQHDARENDFLMESSTQKAVHSRYGDRTLVIMAKAPKPGRVKTRLAQHLPLPAITAFYRCLLDDTIALARSLGTVHVAMMCPGADVNELVPLVDDQVQVVAQKGDGLAAGLTSVFAQFANGGRQRIIAFNSDSPHLPPSILEAAFEILTSHDIVVGPTHDGGYYLVGAKALHPALFEGDGIGTINALDRLLGRARALELSIGFTPPFYDIDVANDLIQLAAELRHEPARAPRTAAWLAEWDQAVAQLPARPEGL